MHCATHAALFVELMLSVRQSIILHLDAFGMPGKDLELLPISTAYRIKNQPSSSGKDSFVCDKGFGNHQTPKKCDLYLR